MDQIYRDRLHKLADFLDELPPGRFDYAVWVSYPDGEPLSPTATCGTTACAFGWATAIPEFQALGLHLAEANNGPAVCVGEPLPQEQAIDASQRAAREIFGLTPEGFRFLFIPSRDDPGENGPDLGSDGKPYETASAHNVAQHIREFADR